MKVLGESEAEHIFMHLLLQSEPRPALYMPSNMAQRTLCLICTEFEANYCSKHIEDEVTLYSVFPCLRDVQRRLRYLGVTSRSSRDRYSTIPNQG